MNSREGNVIPSDDATLRSEISDKSMCKTCIHVVDKCKGITKIKRIGSQNYILVEACDGFEVMCNGEGE